MFRLLRNLRTNACKRDAHLRACGPLAVLRNRGNNTNISCSIVFLCHFLSEHERLKNNSRILSITWGAEPGNEITRKFSFMFIFAKYFPNWFIQISYKTGHNNFSYCVSNQEPIGSCFFQKFKQTIENDHWANKMRYGKDHSTISGLILE